MEKKERKQHPQPSKEEEKVNIRCRRCFLVDGYVRKDTKCKHCGAKIFVIDAA